MKTLFYIFVFVATLFTPFMKSIAQTNTFPSTGSAGIGTTTPNASSILEMKSTTQGMLTPRMTATQRNAIGSPATGLVIYQTNSSPGFYYFDGSQWTSIAGANKTLSNLSSTKVNVNLNPTADDSLNLGSTSYSWKNLYLDSSVYLGGNRFLAYACGSGANNTAAGVLALKKNNTGYDNTATGYNALYSNTSGYHNTANGEIASYKNTTGNSNTAIGVSALYATTTGSNNTAVGDLALTSNTASGNTALGAGALSNNTTADGNTATGFNSLYNNTTGNRNTANGYYALFSNNTGYENTVMGYKAFYSNTTGVKNTAMGSNALYSNTTGGGNTSVGESSMYTNTTGSYNTAFGNGALVSNTTGYSNAANGYYALAINSTGKNNTATGYYALYSSTADDNTATGTNALFTTTGYGNTAIGSNALYTTGSASYNTASGYYALYYNTGYSNVADGADALYGNTSGGANTATGTDALYTNATGSYLTVDGYFADVNADGYSDATAIGADALITASNQVRIGDSYTASIGGYQNWSNISDGRVKKNIKANVPGLSFIRKLKPVTYNLDLDAADKIVQKPSIKTQQQNMQPSAQMLAARSKKEQVVYSGFVAQDVEKAAKDIGYDFSGVDPAKNDKDLYALRYAEFVVPLVKAVQELAEQNDELKKNYEARVHDLQNQIDELKALIVSNQSTINSQLSTVRPSASLSQNIPNPFNHTTTINYSLPEQYSSARIIITDKGGKVVKTFDVSGNRMGSLHVNAATMASGAYQYSLYINGNIIDSKQLILSK